MSLLQVKNVTKTYGSGHTAVHALKNVSLDVQPGGILLIIGPSGSGKTTLLSMIGTLLSPTRGSILFEGKSLEGMSRGALAKTRLREIGFIFQGFNLLSALTAEQNVMVPLTAAGADRKQARRKARELLGLLGLESRLHNVPQDLSGGEKQRVAIARALANDPKLILADEPTANLDSKTGHEVMQLLCSIACREGRSVIIVSHDTRLRDTATRIITIEDGTLVREEKGGHDKTCTMHKKA